MFLPLMKTFIISFVIFIQLSWILIFAMIIAHELNHDYLNSTSKQQTISIFQKG